MPYGLLSLSDYSWELPSLRAHQRATEHRSRTNFLCAFLLCFDELSQFYKYHYRVQETVLYIQLLDLHLSRFLGYFLL